jgi:hypothetical protein
MNRAQRRFHATVRPGTRGRIHTSQTSWSRADAAWFEANPARSHRTRPRFSGEWFVEPGDAPGLDRVAVKQITPGLRARSAFEIPNSPCAEHVREAAGTEHGASIMFDLAVRGAGRSGATSSWRCSVRGRRHGAREAPQLLALPVAVSVGAPTSASPRTRPAARSRRCSSRPACAGRADAVPPCTGRER